MFKGRQANLQYFSVLIGLIEKYLFLNGKLIKFVEIICDYGHYKPGNFFKVFQHKGQ